ncbi:DUF1653 domain-containing protein [Bacillus sp. M6-12]|uniref:DUF1653 domain-containing protein n=1 Tax=Bacillus sp. M6-12 TaxID=2054166 RepID=UPI000C778FB4|nr:DUF1653 domain-containing protein [Bacillus sp. M6-12]PLS19101.1 DUF1653 domain-containing protein [Bacillus sp. M6-12]
MYKENGIDFEVGRCYRHFKGMLYYVIGIGEHTETHELQVCYKALYGDNKLHFRPYDMFIEEVPEDKQPENVTGQTYRFEPFEAKQVI